MGGRGGGANDGLGARVGGLASSSSFSMMLGSWIRVAGISDLRLLLE